MQKVNIFLEGIPRAELFSQQGQEFIINEAVEKKKQGDHRSFREIVEDSVFIYSITQEIK